MTANPLGSGYHSGTDGYSTLDPHSYVDSVVYNDHHTNPLGSGYHWDTGGYSTLDPHSYVDSVVDNDHRTNLLGSGYRWQTEVAIPLWILTSMGTVG